MSGKQDGDNEGLYYRHGGGNVHKVSDLCEDLSDYAEIEDLDALLITQ